MKKRESDRTDIRLEDGRALHVAVEGNLWSACLDEDPQTLVHGFPLEGVLMEVFGLNPAHQDTPAAITDLARRVRVDIPRVSWPSDATD